ncbi:hypothetical protein EE612_052116, partial [Oryza sativa]
DFAFWVVNFDFDSFFFWMQMSSGR